MSDRFDLEQDIMNVWATAEENETGDRIMYTNVHDIKKIELSDIKEQFSGSFVRDIVITYGKNHQEFTITLFSRDAEGDALILREQSHEDWK